MFSGCYKQVRKSNARAAQRAVQGASNLGSTTYVAAMTSQPRHIAAGMELPAQETAWRIEIIDTLRLSWPMALTQLGQSP